MSISKSKAKPWIVFDEEDQEEAEKRAEEEGVHGAVRKSKFF